MTARGGAARGGGGRSKRWRRVGQAVLDVAAFEVALFVAALLRLDLDFHRIDVGGLLAVLPVVAVAQVTAGAYSGLYRGRWIFGSFEEVAALARTVASAAAALLVVDVFLPSRHPVPVSAVLGGGMIAFLAMGAVRYGWRLVADRRYRPQLDGREPVLVFGVGDGGQRLVRSMLRDADCPYVPVALLDDDPYVRNLSFMGLRVVGGRDSIGDAARRFGAKLLCIAVPSANASLVRELLDLAIGAHLDVRILPSVRELLDDDVRAVDLRVPTEADLLGRHEIETDLGAVAQYLTGRRVAVTGAGGSIGAELCRQIAGFRPAELLMIDRDESALHAVQLTLDGRALLDSPDLVLVDIRDRVRMRKLFEERRPHVVFHAAALKHLPLLEAHPVEALKTNVWGTLSVLEAARAADVGTFINISTDKAANPCSVLGFSKRVAEGLTAHAARVSDGTYASVRFGNVLGSRGSVLTTFRAQLDAREPLTVTHPEAQRFFMTVEEAVQLVLQAAALGGGGDALVLDMGEPVRIADVARRLAATVTPPVPIEFVGLRPGEKLQEELFGDGERCASAGHPLIHGVGVPPLDPIMVRDLDPTLPRAELVAVFEELCLSMNLEFLSDALDSWQDVATDQASFG